MNSTKLTEMFLTTLSKHLSSRDSCKGVEYQVVISQCDEDTSVCYISIQPNVHVFPNVHSRRPEDKLPVVDHIVLSHFYSELYGHADIKGNICVIRDNIVPGTYLYQLSADRRRRRWTRLK